MNFEPKPEPEYEPGRAYIYWKKQAVLRQRIIDKQDKAIADLTASVVSLENDYDTVETELRALTGGTP